jgi:predicted NAD/FAD-binding protein/DUF1365 family protein
VTPDSRRSVAVVGSGVAGLTAAYVLSRPGNDCTVTLFEADDRLGGHADTHDVTTPDGTLRIDTGFIVHNERTYPVLLRLFAELGVETQESEMSMSVSCAETGIEYAGALGPRGLFPTWRNLSRPAYLRMLVEIPRFHRRARALLEGPDDDRTLREFLDEGRFSALFRTHFAEAVVACVWSCDAAVALDYPARYLFAFLDHHGMLGVFGSPQWRTVTGGSHAYVDRVAAALDEVRLGTKVTSVVETSDGVEITDGNGVVSMFDAVVVATHPDQALGMLASPTPLQAEVLGAMPYAANTAQLHTDTSLLPRARAARASWNYLRRGSGSTPVTVTYDLTRLQRLPTGTAYLVTLGGADLVDPDSVIETREYAHPIYTPASVAAQRRLPEIDTDRVVFAGAYHGWGFHEDGARSGLAAAERLGVRWSSTSRGFETSPSGSSSTTGPETSPSGSSSTTGPETSPSGSSSTTGGTLYDVTITHTRRKPFKRTFTHRSTMWLVDLDDLPDHGVLARFEARDHLGDPGRSIRANVDAFLHEHDVERPARILMTANARAFGFCFNPISVFWCFDGEGRQTGVVVEVHNTYGDRHAYLVHPDEQGRARTDKAMYVSPFHGTDGTYELAVPLPSRTPGGLKVAVTLHSDDGAAFSASFTGSPAAASFVGLVRSAPAALRGAALIRAHGIWLWARRLPVINRPAHPPQKGVR